MPPDVRQFRVLIVDDDPAMGKFLAAVVNGAGYGTPAVVGTGKDALQAASEADMILLDHVLPDAVGVELLPGLRSLPRPPGIILITASGDEALAATALRAGADDYLAKDGALGRLLPEVIERVRRGRALREALAAAERDLVHAERRAAIGQLNVTLHHTINNPLMAAMAEVELLRSGSPLDEQQLQSVTAIRDALLRISEILQQVSSLRHDHTTEYVDGIEMIDLSRRTRATPVVQGEALLGMPEGDVSRVVTMLLTHAGYAVERVAGREELTRRSQRLGVTLVVVAGGDGPGTDPLGGFRAPEERSYTLVVLTTGDGAAARALGADHVVPLPFDPGTFTSDLLAARRD